MSNASDDFDDGNWWNLVLSHPYKTPSPVSSFWDNPPTASPRPDLRPIETNKVCCGVAHDSPHSPSCWVIPSDNRELHSLTVWCECGAADNAPHTRACWSKKHG